MADSDETPIAFDRDAAHQVFRRNLPHWRQQRAIYFVTFRLADSLPAEKLLAWREERDHWLRENRLPHTADQHRQYVLLWDQRINKWLDAGHGSCLLAKPEIGGAVEQALHHFDRQRYRLGDFVVMPNHVHALVMPLEGWDLSGILHSWKSFTSHEANRVLRRTGALWQDESFDHIVRDNDSWARFSRYIKQNPAMAPPNSVRLGCGDLPQPA